MEGDFDFDWLVIGSGFGGSVSALRLSEKGHSRRRARVRAALRRPRAAELDRRPEALLLAPVPRHEGHLPADHLQGRLRRLRLRRRRRQPRLRQHALRAAEEVLRGPPVGGDERLGVGARAPLRRGAADARRRPEPRHDDPADQLLRELGEELGVGDTYKKTPVGVYFGEPGVTVPDPFFGGEGPDRTGCRDAVAAWSAARTARRTRSSRTTSTSPRSAARR